MQSAPLHHRHWCLVLVWVFLALPVPSFAQSEPSASPKVDPWVLRQTLEAGVAEFLVLLKDQADLSPARSLRTKHEKGTFVYETLLRKAQGTQGPVRAWLEAQGVPHRSYYIVNMLWARGDRSVVDALALRSDVWRIEGNPSVRGIVGASPEAKVAPLLGVEPNIATTNAPAVWGLGFTGQGVVLGGQDTGYQWDHPALRNQYRGWNNGVANHDYNWHDSIHSGGGSCGANNSAPCDDSNHGTHTMGTAVGDDGAGNQIGMAPGARWICSRNMDQGNGTPATYTESFEFFLAPYPVGGTPAQGNPSLAPDVTTNSWLCPPSEGCSTTSLLLAVQAQRAAGIVTVVAAGNSGSNCSTVADPPAIYDEVFSIGALSTSGNLAGFSSRGPVTSDGSNRMKPDLTAPGTQVRSSVTGSGYQGGWAGTSMATPHVAGAVALLLSAHPSLKGQVDVIEQILTGSAIPEASTSCSSNGVPNNLYGFGRLDVFAAVNMANQATLSATSTMLSGAAGGVVVTTLMITNTGWVTESFQLTAGPSGFPVSFAQTVVGPLTPGQSASVVVGVQIPQGLGIGVSDAVTISATPQGYMAVIPTVGLTSTVAAGAPSLALVQPPALGPFLQVQNGGLLSGHEYANVFSLEPCGAMPGPYLGLCTVNPQGLIDQLAIPLGVLPFRFLASGTTMAFGPYPVPSGIAVQAVTLDLTGGGLLAASPVASVTIQ